MPQKSDMCGSRDTLHAYMEMKDENAGEKGNAGGKGASSSPPGVFRRALGKFRGQLKAGDYGQDDVRSLTLHARK